MSKPDGGPAFSRSGLEGLGKASSQDGMTLRDYFAAKAMQAAMLSSKTSVWVLSKDDRALLAEGAYDQADAMLAEREKSS